MQGFQPVACTVQGQLALWFDQGTERSRARLQPFVRTGGAAG